MGVHDLSEEHTHQWVFIGTASYYDRNSIFKLYQCQECSCWARQELERANEEKLARGEIVRSSIDAIDKGDES